MSWIHNLAWAVVPHLKHRAKFRATWGQARDTDGWLASRSFDLSRTESAAKWVDDRTWSDLEFPRIFSDLNTTITPIGRQFLYKQLRTYEYGVEILSQRHEAYRVLGTDSSLREKLQLILKHLEMDATAYIADTLLGPPPEKPRHHVLINAWAFCSVMAFIATIAFSLPPWLVGVVLAVNAVIIFTRPPSLHRDANTLVICRSMLGVADKLATLSGDRELAPLVKLLAERPKRAELRKDVRRLAFLAGNPALAGVALLADLCFLARIVAYIRTVDRFVRVRHEWVSTYELIGSIDASIAVSSFLHRTPRYCRPVVSTGAVISLQSGYHPLLKNPIEHSVTLDNRSALVTGSNMAGKTTFVKMIGTNIVLGHTLGICLASAATIPQSSVMVSIRGEQSVESGKSRYFAEVEAIRGFIYSASKGECRVFVIDEIFSGTNTIERVAAAKTVLSAISEHAQVLATTHDVELQQLLTGNFDLFYFQENPAVPGFFDYKLQSGISTERNAIRVLERMGFPAAIIREALAQVSLHNQATKPA